MEFGDKKSFAVELSLDENYNGAWLCGKLCYWINGVQVGDFELGTSLRDVLFQMKWIVHDCGNRHGGILCELRPQDVFSKLDESLYGSSEDQASNDFLLPDSPARFNITLPVDIFDQWKAYLLECGDKSTILFKNIHDMDIKEGVIPTGLFDNVIKEVYEFLNYCYEKEIKSN